MSSKPAPAVIAVGVIRAGAPTISSAFEVVREEALPSKSPRRPALRPERRPFPKISTNNDQLMMAIRVCVHFGVAQAIPLFTTILVRCGGKGHCWASTEVWRRAAEHGRALAQHPGTGRADRGGAPWEQIGNDSPDGACGLPFEAVAAGTGPRWRRRIRRIKDRHL